VSPETAPKLRVVRGARRPPEEDGVTTVSFEEVTGWARGGKLAGRLLRFREAGLLVPRLEAVTRPLATATLLRGLSRGPCWVEDETGARMEITPGTISAYAARFLRDAARRPLLLRRVAREVEALERTAAGRTPSPVLDLTGTAVYLRTDLWFGVQSGGSVAHVAGVANHLGEFTGGPLVLSTDRLATVRDDLPLHLVRPTPEFWDFRDLPSLRFNEVFNAEARRVLRGRRVSLVYQRYSINNYSGVVLSRETGVPLVLEYNGSGVWIGRHWGEPLRYERLSERIELLNLRAADLVVVNSAPMRDEVVERGVAPERVLVNPNGVDAERYSPAVDGSRVRARYGLEGKTVVGFIGTFGPWHGAEVLADAFGRLVHERPALRESTRLLLIGDGPRMPEVRAALAAHGVEHAAVLTGLVPQEEGAAHLAACDVLASPHVPNPDGTPFFGSPTKLFEYMAMERGIVASDLDQIGEILRHGETAWLVEPGSAEALTAGLKVLLDDAALRARLGEAARREAVERHTWREHTRRIVDALRERCR